MHTTEKRSTSLAATFESLAPFVWIVAAALGLSEAWLFAERFSTDALELSQEVWAPWVRAARFHTPWCLCVLSVVVLTGGRALRAEVQHLSASTARHTSGLLALFLHLASLYAFYACTEALLDHGPESTAWRSALPLAWIASGASAAFWLWGIVFPARVMVAALWRARIALVCGVAVGTPAYIAGAYLFETWPFWEPLARATLWLTDLFVACFASQRVYDAAGMVLGTPSFPVHVTRACSGYEGISLFLAFYTFFLILYRERLRFPHALLLLPLGSLAVWILNAVRIALLIGVGTVVSPDVAIQGFHVYAGWPFVALAALSTVVVATRVRWFVARAAVAHEPAAANLTAAYLGPFLAVVASSMLCGAMTSAPEMLYPVRIAAALSVLWWYRRQYAALAPASPWASIAWGAVCAAVWLAFGFAAGPTFLDSDPHAWQASAPPAAIAMWWCTRVSGFVVVAPVCEELAFRGYLARRLSAKEFEGADPRRLPLPACAISALLFGLAHDAWAAGLVVGFVFALRYRARGSLLDAVVCHATTNALLASYAITTGHWWAWS